MVKNYYCKESRKEIRTLYLKSCPILYIKSIDEIGQDFLDPYVLLFQDGNQLSMSVPVS